MQIKILQVLFISSDLLLILDMKKAHLTTVTDILDDHGDIYARSIVVFSSSKVGFRIYFAVAESIRKTPQKLLLLWGSGGEQGIRTLEQVIARYTISKRTLEVRKSLIYIGFRLLIFSLRRQKLIF